MAAILNDSDLKRLIETGIIVNGDKNSVRPNSYILHLGGDGEFLNASKEFSIGTANKKGIKISPGHMVAVTSLEAIDFRPGTVEKVFPGCALHAIVSPTTDLSREGIVAPTTQVDAGFFGTLNWTITNSSNQERRFLFNERIYRLTIWKLAEGEVPAKFYDGDYQNQKGYVRSQRKGAPVGMRESEWENSNVEGGPEAILDNLIKSGYPWHALGTRFKEIDQQFKIVSEEYAAIHDSLESLSEDVESLGKQSTAESISDAVSNALNEQTTSMQNRWLVASASMFAVLLGLIIAIISSDVIRNFLNNNGGWIGLLIIILAAFFLIRTVRKKR